jgi:hypothetical protein
MNTLRKFALQIEEPWIWEGLEPPEDSLGELSDWDMRLRRFCFDYNHKVLMEIGDEKKYVFLDPDIIMILNELPEKIANLSVGHKISIDFPESWMIVELMPVAMEINCTLRKFGNFCEQKHFELDKLQVLGVLRRFLDEVMELAMDKGYIRPEEKDEFLKTAFITNASIVFPA